MLTLEEIAKAVGMNPAYLSHVFHRETGIKLFEYIQERRMEKAKELIGRTNAKMIEVCQRVGYENQRYFCQVFKRYTGMTALEYRNQKKKQKSPNDFESI